MGGWESTKFKRVGYEIKVSRSDWMNELRNPMKRQLAMFLTHEFWFACAPGVIKPTAITEDRWYGDSRSPDWTGFDRIGDVHGCGVLEIREDGKITVLRKAPRRKAWPMPEDFIASLLRRVDEEPEPDTASKRDMSLPLFRSMEVPV